MQIINTMNETSSIKSISDLSQSNGRMFTFAAERNSKSPSSPLRLGPELFTSNNNPLRDPGIDVVNNTLDVVNKALEIVGDIKEENSSFFLSDTS